MIMTVLFPDTIQIKKDLWEAKVFPILSDKCILTIEGENECETELECLGAIRKKNWNIVELSKRGRIEGIVDVRLKELLAHNKETFPRLLALRLATGFTIRNIKYKLNFDCCYDNWIAFNVSGYIVKKPIKKESIKREW